jgi:hypothetical protein
MRYKAEARKGYWVLIDTYTGELASCPTTRTNAYSEARYMNRMYAEALAEEKETES